MIAVRTSHEDSSLYMKPNCSINSIIAGLLSMIKKVETPLYSKSKSLILKLCHATGFLAKSSRKHSMTKAGEENGSLAGEGTLATPTNVPQLQVSSQIREL